MSTTETLRRAVRRAVTRTRGLAAGAVVLAALMVVPATLLMAWVGGGWTARAGPLALVAAAAIAALVLAAGLVRRWVLTVDDEAVARAAEQEQGLPDGALRAVLELGRGLPAGVSSALFHRTETELADRLAVSTPALAGHLGRRTRRRGIRAVVGTVVLVLGAVAVGLAAPDRARAAWTPLLRPVAHLDGPTLPPLAVVPGDTTVDRGAVLAVTVRAPLRETVDVRWRSVGSVPGARTLAVTDGAARGSLGAVEAPTRYWVEAPDGAVTDTFTVEPRDPLLLSELVVDVVYPAHTGLGRDHFRNDVPALRLPEGTRLRVRGRATRPLEAVSLVRDGGGEREADVDGHAFGLDWRPALDADGTWEWRVRSRDGATGPSVPLTVTVVPDEAPSARVVVPGVDTLMPASLRQPIVADATDDYGVTAGSLVARRRGAADSTVTALDAGPSAPRTLLRGVLDATGWGLGPGEAVEYYVTVRDNSPWARTGRSATYILRLPDRRELRQRAQAEAGVALADARRLAEEGRRLESATRDLSRSARTDRASEANPPSGEPVPGRSEDRSPDRLFFDDAAEAAELAARQAAALEDAEALRDRLTELERTVTEAGLQDPALRRRLAELRALYERVASPELRQAVEELRAAVEELDPAAVQEALERLAQDQETFRRQVEESLALMRRAAAEQELNALARGAEEIAARQEALTAAMEEGAGQEGDAAAGEPGDRAAQQSALAEEAHGLAGALDSLESTFAELDEPAGMGATRDAGGRTRTARERMVEAARAARAGRGTEAARDGRTASGELRAAAERLDGARESMSRARTAEARASVQQATRDALELATGEEALRQELLEGQGAAGEARRRLRAEHAALREGLEQVARNLADAGRSALLDRPVREALEGARGEMERTADQLADSGSPLPVAAAGDAVERLNQLALSLLENDGRLRQGQEGGAQRALQRLAELAREQGALNGQAGALGAMALSREALSRRLQELAREQAEIGGRVEDVDRKARGRGDVLGDLEALAGEAREIAREMEDGRVDPELRARQERLFHRLLDAGRSLRRDERSEERVGERAATGAGEDPAALDPALLDAGLRYPVPSADQLRGLPPAYRALVLEYFDRLNRTAGSGTGGGR